MTTFIFALAWILLGGVTIRYAITTAKPGVKGRLRRHFNKAPIIAVVTFPVFLFVYSDWIEKFKAVSQAARDLVLRGESDDE